MNTRKTAPVIGIVSLVALLSGVTGTAAQARVMIDGAPTAAAAQGERLSQYAAAYEAAKQGVSFERTEAIRSAKQAEARIAPPQALAFERTEAIRSAKQAEAGTTRLSAGEAQGIRLQKYAEAQTEATGSAGSDAVDDFLSPLNGDR